jgi:hypothetical protein
MGNITPTSCTSWCGNKEEQMKKSTFALAVLPLVIALLMSACADMIMERPETLQMAGGEGLLVVSLAGVNVGTSSGRTMLPIDPQFTRYELVFFADATGDTLHASLNPYSFYNTGVQLNLPDNTYYIAAGGYAGDTLVAKSSRETVTVTAGTISQAAFTLKPYMDDVAEDPVPGVLSFSLNWDGLSRMPYRAELLIEQYADATAEFIDGHPPIPQTLIPPEYRAGSTPGSILLLDSGSAIVNLTGSLTLPPGEYLLTMSVTMDQADTGPVSRLDYAHIYSNLTTLAPFYYGSGALYISNTSPDSGAGFITGFTFKETPNATTVIGSEPGVDGTRMIMIMVPGAVDLTSLTPDVTTAPGAVITSPQKAQPTPPTLDDPDPSGSSYPPMDFSNPMVWTAQAKNGAVQQYTVVVSATPNDSDDRMITNFFFKEHLDVPGNINQGTGDTGATITITLPYGAEVDGSHLLTPIVTIIGKSVVDVDADQKTTVPDGTTAQFDFTNPRIFKVTSEAGSTKEYTVTVHVVEGSGTAEITRFSIEGYLDRIAADPATSFGSIADTEDNGYYPITLRLPYGVSLANLTPIIHYEGKTLNPLSGVPQNFSVPVYYTVTPQTGSPKTYKVTITNDEPDKDTGIFDFRVANVPAAKVVIGQKPRQDGKIPIVIQVPFGTDEKKMIADITLSGPDAEIHPFVLGVYDSSAGASGVVIPFGNNNNPKEAVYRVTSEGGAATQDYVVVVSQGPQYYYVDGTNGNDGWPDYYNGGSKDYPFKTLAHAVEEAAKDGIEKVFIIGDLTPANGGDNSPSAESAFTISGTKNGAGETKKITITSVTGSTLGGSPTQRVLTVQGGADLVFENINISGGKTLGNGGGIYIKESSKVKFSGGGITGNTAYSGGGVYIESPDEDGADAPVSEFTLMNGEISGNTATGAASGNSAAYPLGMMGGGGGVYIKGNATFWLAAGGTISGNTAAGAGGGVLVNGYVDSTTSPGDPIEYGLLMSGGRIVSNTSTSGTYPHGGGGVYVAHGAFEMLDGEVTGNTATRQGGGVFVHWGAARFTASGNSTITGNSGVGSSKAICNRGTTTMIGSARADKVYVWNYDDDPGAFTDLNNQTFTLAQNAQIAGIVLAYSEENANVITIADSFTGTNTICTIDLESHLSNGLFAGKLEPDWLNKKIIVGTHETLKKVLGIEPAGPNRLPLNTFTGTPSVYNVGANYKIDVADSNAYGTFKKK